MSNEHPGRKITPCLDRKFWSRSETLCPINTHVVHWSHGRGHFRNNFWLRCRSNFRALFLLISSALFAQIVPQPTSAIVGCETTKSKVCPHPPRFFTTCAGVGGRGEWLLCEPGHSLRIVFGTVCDNVKSQNSRRQGTHLGEVSASASLVWWSKSSFKETRFFSNHLTKVLSKRKVWSNKSGDLCGRRKQWRGEVAELHTRDVFLFSDTGLMEGMSDAKPLGGRRISPNQRVARFDMPQGGMTRKTRKQLCHKHLVFKRLGYCSFKSNEASEYRAREQARTEIISQWFAYFCSLLYGNMGGWVGGGDKKNPFWGYTECIFISTCEQKHEAKNRISCARLPESWKQCFCPSDVCRVSRGRNTSWHGMAAFFRYVSHR